MGPRMRGPFLALVTVAILVGLVCSGVVCWTPEKHGWEPPELLVREPEEALRVREGQLVIVGLPGTTLDPLTKDALARGHVAGVILMARNIEDTAQVRSLCRDIYLAVPPEEPPPIICVDQEGG
ncbi:MAG: hypothetical protein GF320_07925, partial [Armatimonadia bacterium]|nr:hypothetical protein [Armatimonadia bacterium]